MVFLLLSDLITKITYPEANPPNVTSFDEGRWLQAWLANLTSRNPDENCQSCLFRCGRECFDMCHLLADCNSHPEARVSSELKISELNLLCMSYFITLTSKDSNLTSLTILLRGMLNSTSGIRPSDNDPLDICYQCGIGATHFDNATDVNNNNSSEMYSSTLEPTPKGQEVAGDTAFIPLEDRHCTKMICR